MQWGSSPLARGTRHATRARGAAAGLIPARAGNTLSPVRFGVSRPGLIPARAGNTSAGAMRCLPHRAHPRSRGEHGRDRSRLHCVGGSSPLARGTHCGWHRVSAGLGLIPARAGNTVVTGDCRRRPGAHPRSRGEHRCVRWGLRRRWGSSPLARGTP